MGAGSKFFVRGLPTGSMESLLEAAGPYRRSFDGGSCKWLPFHGIGYLFTVDLCWGGLAVFVGLQGPVVPNSLLIAPNSPYESE